MKRDYLKKNKILGVNLFYVLSLLPIIIYSFYKNGIVVYKAGLISLFASLQYLVIPFVIIALSYVFECFYYMYFKKEDEGHNVVNSLVPYINTLCYLVCSPIAKLWITIPIIVVLTILMKVLENKVNINQVALFKCILLLIGVVAGVTSNANFYESANELTFNKMQYFIGNGVGEIGTTSTLCALIGFVILLFNRYYKKDVAIVGSIGYALVALLLYVTGSLTFSEMLINLFTSGFMFAIIFVASISLSSPIIKGGRFVYSLLIGIISSVLVNVYDIGYAIYIVILVMSLLVPLFNKLRFTFTR